MFDRCGGERFLAKPRGQHGIVAHQIGKNNFDCVCSFKKGVTSLEDYSHSTPPEPAFQEITTVKSWFPEKRWSGLITVLWTVIDFVGEATPTNRAFFHSVARKTVGRRSE